MTFTWPDDPEVRRAVASWGHLLDEALLCDGRGEVASLDWPDDEAIAHALTEWGSLADSNLAQFAATAEANHDPTIAWLGGPALSHEPLVGLSRPSLPTDLDLPADLEPVGAFHEMAGITRKHKVVRPGQSPIVAGWTVKPAATGGARRLAKHRVLSPDWGWAAMVAAAAAGFLLVGGQALAGAPQGPSQSADPSALGASNTVPALTSQPSTGSDTTTGSSPTDLTGGSLNPLRQPPGQGGSAALQPPDLPGTASRNESVAKNASSSRSGSADPAAAGARPTVTASCASAATPPTSTPATAGGSSTLQLAAGAPTGPAANQPPSAATSGASGGMT
ncbi:MAG: hypothetical protein M3N98_06605, partial [Actinomycetota bacterium]|nr:hypothetical protein [Actinomycetota bacterium]